MRKKSTPFSVPILLFTESLKPGGTEKEVLLLTTYLNRQKFTPLIASLRGDGRVAYELRTLGAPVFDLQFNGYKNLPNFVQTVLKLIKLIKQHEIKIVHAYSFGPTLMGALATFFTKARLISSQRSLHLWKDSKYRRAYQIALLHADHVLSNSESGREQVLQHVGLPANKVEVIYNLVEPPQSDVNLRAEIRKQLGIGRREVVVGMVANLRLVKNPQLFVDTAIDICSKLDGVSFLHLGSVDEFHHLQKKVENAGLADRIRFLGQAPANPYYEAMDIFLLTSNSEGCPMAVLEAMSHGLPIVATGIAGVAEVVQHQVNGILVPPRNQPALTKALRRLIADAGLRRRMAEKSRQIFREQFQTAKVVPKLEGVYEQLL